MTNDFVFANEQSMSHFLIRFPCVIFVTASRFMKWTGLSIERVFVELRLVVLLHGLDEIEIPTQWRWFEIGFWSKQLHTIQVVFNQWHAVIVYIRIWFDHVIGKIHPCLNQTTSMWLLHDASASCSTHWVCYWFLWILLSAVNFFFFVSHVPKTDDID